MSAVPAPWCPTCGPAWRCKCGVVVPDGLREWLRANEQRTARVPKLVEEPDYGEAGLVTRRPIG